jgi:sugar phosphate isomerase/epimerase
MDKSKFYLSTVAADAVPMAKEYGINLEIAEYCTAWNMDEKFAEIDPIVREKLADCPKSLLHGPYNELFPCAIDKKARALAAERYRQAIALAKRYGSEKVIIHGGYNPRIYFPVWYVEQSIVFWKDFMKEVPAGLEICLENVLEEEASMLFDIVSAVNHPQLKLCLDIGHVNAYSAVSAEDWLKMWAPQLSHFHIHNNDRSWDSHRALNCGTIPMKEFLLLADKLCPTATYTLELTEAADSVRWLLEELPWND